MDEIIQLKQQLWGFANKKKELKLKIDFYKEILLDFGVGAQKLSHAPSGSGVANIPEGLALNVEYWQERIHTLSDELVNADKEYETLLSPLNDTERLIINLRHLKGVLWDFVPYAVGYSRMQAIRIYKRALEKILKDGTP